VSDEGALLVAVEDDPRNAALLEAILGRSGYRLRLSRNLQLILNYLLDKESRCVITFG
jgi:hypothetical protein